MRRRELLALSPGAAIAFLTCDTRPQRLQLPLVAVLSPRSAEVNVAALRQGLGELGYVEGRNIRLEIRSGNGDNQRLPALAADIVALKPDVIVTNGEPPIRALRAVAGTTPIVMAIVSDAVGLGFAQTLSHPGSNLTGLTMVATEVLGKRLELLYEAMPNPGCVAVLSMSGVNYDPSAWQELAGAAKSLRVALQPISVRDASELAAGFTTIVRSQCRAALVMPDPLFVGVRQALVELAAQHRIAVSYDNRLIAEAGGLMSYGPDTVDMYRRSASYVDKILKGASPSELPIEQPTKFELVINLKTAKALGLTIPQSLLARADEVIE